MFFSSKINYEIRTDARGVAKGGDGVARAPRNLADQLTLLKPRGGADYARHTTASPPGCKMLSTPLGATTPTN